MQLTLVYSLASEKFSDAKKWNNEFKETLSNEESELLARLENYYARMDFIIFKNKGEESILEMSPIKRKKAIFQKINSLIEDQKKALKKLQKSIKIPSTTH